MPDIVAPKRFRLLRRLGEGGMGVVYEALDEERDTRVALKTVRTMSAEALARFKAEFRALQDLHHPNLVTLGELINEGDQWFFTMEIVEGNDFLAYVRSRDDARDAPDSIAPSSVGYASTKRIPIAVARGEELPATFDEARLRSAMAQLTSALVALHGANKVHCDIKPANIRVARDGRLVLLDFGLVVELDRDQRSTNMHVVGTPDYMAPEQAASKVLGPSADWYSVGVLLYEALTGALPYAGAPLEVLLRKQQSDGPSPSARVPDVPQDLDTLCAELLRFDPASRPNAARVLTLLGVTSLLPASRSNTQNVPFVGREPELEFLRKGFVDGRRGAVTVLVQGESGVGKSCLVRRFVDSLVIEDPSVVVLTGRCYERELVPYKAFDGVTDSLARYLKRLPREEAATLLPTRPASLLQVFPVLRRVKPFADVATQIDAPKMDLLEQRTRAFNALRDLLLRLADKRPLVIVIDDLQWADADSLTLLAEVLRPPDPPPFLLLGTIRTSESPQAATALTKRLTAVPADVRVVEVNRLSSTQGEELAALLLRGAAANASITARSIAEEAGGHPLFIDALVRHAALGGADAIAAPKLDEALWSQIHRLDPVTRRIMELIAIAGAPIVQDVLASAADTDQKEFAKSIAYLRVAHLASIAGGRGRDTIEPYHDKVRAAVVAKLDDADKRDCHRKLAVALDALGNADAESLAVHWRGAGDELRAAHYSEMAGDESAKALAFDHAASLFVLALTTLPPNREKRLALRVKLGDALANAGRSALSANAYREAAVDASPAMSLDLRRRAADQLLRGGHFDAGLAAAREVLAVVGMKLPRTPFGALIMVVVWNVYLAIRGLDFERRDSSELTASEVTRADVCWSVSFSLSFSDHIRGAAFGARNLAIALRLGEARRVARALALQIGYIGSGGTRTWNHTQRLIARATALAESINDPHTTAWVAGATGLADYLRGHAVEAIAHLDRSRQIFVSQCTGVAWEVDTVQMLAFQSFAFIGSFREVTNLQPRYLREAAERGDVYAIANLCTGAAGLYWLVRDEPREARERSREAMKDWSSSGFHVEHFLEESLLVWVDLYERNVRDAARRAKALWDSMGRSLLRRIQINRIITRHIRALSLLSLAEVDPTWMERALRVAASDVRELEAEHCEVASGNACLLRAGIAAVSGRSNEQVAGYAREAVTHYESVGSTLYAESARRLLGFALGGDEGGALIAAVDRWMTDQGVRSPTKFARCFAAGFARYEQSP